MNVDNLEVLLRKLPPDVISGFIGAQPLDAIATITGCAPSEYAHTDTGRLAKTLAVLRGEQILEDPAIRAALFQQLPADELRDLATGLCGTAFEKPADNALALSSLPWRSESPVVLTLAERLAIPAHYLPRHAISEPSTSIIRPCLQRPELRDYQIEVNRELTTLFATGARRVLVQMPTGAGKTRTAIEAVCDLALRDNLFGSGRSVLWLAHVEELCEQAISAFADAWTARGNMPATVVRLWGNYKPDLNDYEGAFIVGTYQKLVALGKRPSELEHIKRCLGFVIADEAHKVLAPTYEELLARLVSDDICLLGLTATPGRGLQLGYENARLAAFFDKNLVGPMWQGNPIRDLQDRGILSRIRHRTIESKSEIKLTAAEQKVALLEDLPVGVINRLATTAERNRKIIDAVHEQSRAGRSCIVFACSTSHSRTLTAVLNLENERAAHLDALVSRSHRRELMAKFRSGELNILSNFGVLSTGLDVPRVSAVLITRPTTSVVLYSQMIGRGLRGPASGGNAECHLIDVRDNFVNFGAVDAVYQAFSSYWE